MIVTQAETIEAGEAYYSDMKARAKRFGRDADQLFILPSIAAIVGDGDEEAEARYRELAALKSIDTGRGFLSCTFNEPRFVASGK